MNGYASLPQSTGGLSMERLSGRYDSTLRGKTDKAVRRSPVRDRAPSLLRQAYTYKLKPTPDQERQLEAVLWPCRRRYNTALEQRITLGKQRGVTRSQYEQEADLTDLRAALPEYAAIHSHVLHDVLARLNTT